MNKTKIEWCDCTLNPVIGCTYGCKFCYARRLNNRFGWIKNFESPEFFIKRLEKLKAKKSQNVFMDSMSDIADWKPEWVHQTFEAIKKNPQHKMLFFGFKPLRKL
jgi:protein gp37